MNSARFTMTQKASRLFATGVMVIPTHANKTFLYPAKHTTAAGEEVVVSYGSHSNDYLLVECKLRVQSNLNHRQITHHVRWFHSLREQRRQHKD